MYVPIQLDKYITAFHLISYYSHQNHCNACAWFFSSTPEFYSAGLGIVYVVGLKSAVDTVDVAKYAVDNQFPVLSDLYSSGGLQPHRVDKEL